MAAMTTHLIQGVERKLHAQDEICHAQVAKIEGGQRRQQIEANVRRRCAVRDHAAWRLLKVVGGQPILFGADEAFIERPGAARKCAESALFLCRQLFCLAHRWMTYPVGDLRREYPGNKKRSRYSQCTRIGN